MINLGFFLRFFVNRAPQIGNDIQAVKTCCSWCPKFPDRLTICMENVGMSGNLADVRQMTGSHVRKQSCHV